MRFLSPYVKQARLDILNVPSEEELLVVRACILCERGLPDEARSLLETIPESKRSAAALQMLALLASPRR
jgi:hypothetical protein